MNPFEPFTPASREFVRTVSFVFVFLSGVLATAVSQASSPNYGELFRMVMPVAVLHFAMSIIYFVKVRHWTRWFAFGLSALVFALVGGLAFNIWL